MTLEAWVYPTSVTKAWRDVIYKGDDNYYLEATSTLGFGPVGAGGTFGGSGTNILGLRLRLPRTCGRILRRRMTGRRCGCT